MCAYRTLTHVCVSKYFLAGTSFLSYELCFHYERHTPYNTASEIASNHLRFWMFAPIWDILFFYKIRSLYA